MSVPAPEMYGFVKGGEIMLELKETLRLIGEDAAFNGRFLAALDSYDLANNSDHPRHNVYKALIQAHLERLGHEFGKVPMGDLAAILDAVEGCAEVFEFIV